MSDNTRFDTGAGCSAELADVNGEIAEFAHEWASAAGRLKANEMRYERAYRAAMRGLKNQDGTVQEKAATAHLAVETIEGGEELVKQIEADTGKVEEFKTRFKTLERRASNAQSILGRHRDERKLDGYTNRTGPTYGRRS